MNCEVRTLGNLHPSDLEILGPRGANCLRSNISNTPLSAVYYYIALVSQSVIPFLEEPLITVLNVVTNEGLV